MTSQESRTEWRDPFTVHVEQELTLNRGWFLILGVILIVLGLAAAGSAAAVGEAYVLYLGFVLVFSGAVSALQAFRTRNWSGFFLPLFVAILDVIVGLLMLTHPGELAAVMTLLLAAFFFISGLVRILAAVSLRFPSWWWSVLAGVIAVLLGVAIWRRWPLSSYWVIGLFLGIELLSRGWSLVMFALALPRRAGPSA
jgi:uncharacterized membrane protein HdeD (DUF308 family)